MNDKTWLAVVIGAVLVLAAFWGGLWYERLSAPPSVAPTSAAQIGKAPVAAPIPPTSSVSGHVVAKTSSSITLKLLDGTMQTILVASTTVIVPAQTTLSSISVGEMVSAIIPRSTSGSPTAQLLEIVPPPSPTS